MRSAKARRRHRQLLWACWALWLTAACGGSSDAATGGPSCEAVCEAQARCASSDTDAQTCIARCDEQRGVFNQTAWSALTECTISSDCSSQGSCMQRAISATSRAPVDAFLSDMCEWVSGCSAGVYSKAQCMQELDTLGSDTHATHAADTQTDASQSTNPWDFLRLLRASTVDCMSSCIRGQGCAQTNYGMASAACSNQCGLGALGSGSTQSDDNGDVQACEAEHGSCGEHGAIRVNENAGCECSCDQDYVSSDWVCVAGCQQTGCADHGSCDTSSGVCSCDEGYAPTPGAADGCKEIPHFSAVAAGERSSCGLRSDTAVECWGDPSDPVQKPPSPNQGFVQLSIGGGASGSSACALRDDGQTVCWGGVKSPNERMRSVSLDGDLACGLRYDDQTVSCWGFSPYGVNLPTTSGPFAQVSVGDRVGCGVRADHSAACWGDSAILTKLPSPLTDVAQICARSSGACVRHTDGSIACFGFATYASATIPEPNKGYVDVTCGDSLACGLRSDGRAECWGQNSLLGSLAPDATERFTDIDAGKDYACGLHADGSVGCWGRNSNSQAPRSRTASLSLH